MDSEKLQNSIMTRIQSLLTDWLMMLTGRTAAQVLPPAVYPFLPGGAVKIVLGALPAPKPREALRRV